MKVICNNRRTYVKRHNSVRDRVISLLCIVMLLCSLSSRMVLADESETTDSISVSDGGESADGTVVSNAGTAEATAAYPEQPEIYGKAAILMDADTGAILYEKNAHETMYPASITKIMTGLLAVENCALDEPVTYSADVVNSIPYDASRYGLSAGETVTLKDSLYMLILCSANEVAVGLGEHISGSEEEFGKLMTQRAKEAGALNTSFVNASGLHDENHYTTAYDMAMITKAAFENPTYAKVLSSSSYTISSTNLVSAENTVWHTHKMLVDTRAEYYKYAVGGKTGYTDEAGRTLVTYASKDGMNLICVVLFSDTDNVCVDTKTLFEYGFNNFKKVNAATDESRFGQAEDSFFIANRHLFQTAGRLLEFEDAYITIPRDATLSQMGYQIDYDSDIEGQGIATVSYYIGEHFLGEATLTLNIQTDTDVGLVPDKETEAVEYDFKDETAVNIWWIVGVVIIMLVLIIIVVMLKWNGSMRRIRRERKRHRWFRRK